MYQESLGMEGVVRLFALMYPGITLNLQGYNREENFVLPLGFEK